MKRPNFVLRVVVLAFVTVAAIAASSCNSGSGMGVGVAAPTRWGGGTAGPPVFVGGPSF
jgi:hypothetical protein